MTIKLERNQGLVHDSEDGFGLECPHCGVYAHQTPQSVPDIDNVLRQRPRQVGLVYQCDSCRAPVFLRFGVKSYADDAVELSSNFEELERTKEKFAFSYLPKHTEVMFREALSCYSNNNFNAFASMCRRAARSAFAEMGDSGKLRAFDEVMVAQDIAQIDDDAFDPVKKVLFDTGDEETLPMLSRAQAGVLLEVLKDMFYQSFVRHGKLTRAIKVRRLFVQDGNGGMHPSD